LTEGPEAVETNVTIKVPRSFRDRLRKHAQKDHRPIGSLARKIIAEALDELDRAGDGARGATA
jgi:hypothetical protein